MRVSVCFALCVSVYEGGTPRARELEMSGLVWTGLDSRTPALKALKALTALGVKGEKARGGCS